MSIFIAYLICIILFFLAATLTQSRVSNSKAKAKREQQNHVKKLQEEKAQKTPLVPFDYPKVRRRKKRTPKDPPKEEE